MFGATFYFADKATAKAFQVKFGGVIREMSGHSSNTSLDTPSFRAGNGHTDYKSMSDRILFQPSFVATG